MKYFNQFHKESTEKSLKALAEMKKQPINYEEELKRHEEIHERAAVLDKEMEENWRKKKAEKEREQL